MTLLYELAKELEDAGFKSTANTRVWERFVCPHEKKGKEVHIIAQCPEHIYFPTLSELIEACGDEFEGIQHGVMTEDDGSRLWYAATYNNKLIESGPTPEIAVTRLWLALNKNG